MEQNKVYTFKLVTTEEVIAKYLRTDNGFHIIEMPVVIVPTQNGPQLVPYMLTGITKGECPLNTNVCVMIVPSKDDVKDVYLEATTGIQVPSKQIIMG